MSVILGTVNYLGGLGTFAQVLVGLPMALDLLGPPSFLLLSLLFTLHHCIYSTLRLLLKNTPFARLISLLSFSSPSITTACIALTLYFHLNPPPTGPSSFLPGAGVSVRYALVELLPYWYANILRFVSPLFTLGEGIATLLVIQVAGRVGKGWADEDQADEGGVEWRSLMGLVLAAGLYVAGLAGVVKTFPFGDDTNFTAFLLGCALTTVVFLSMIGFSLKRTNVLETSLVFVYVVYSAWISSAESATESRSFGSGWLSHGWASSKSVPEHDVKSLLRRATIGTVDSVYDVAQTLPPHTLVSLVYRVLVLHLAARIVPMIRKASLGWNDGMSDSGILNTDGPGGGAPGFWDGRSLGEEPTNMRITTIILSYRRAILIAVYTHLLFLDAGSQTWWRWINIALFLATWSLELLLDAEDDSDSVSVSRWKVD